MDKTRIPIESSGHKPLLVILVSVLLLMTALSGVAPSQPSEADNRSVIRQVAQKWIEIGAEQYKRGYFRAAKQSFLRAQDYEEYLTPDEREKLTMLVEQTNAGVLERERIVGAIREVEALVGQGKLVEAKTNLEQVKDSKFLTSEERELIAKGIDKLDAQLNAQRGEVESEETMEAPIADVARDLLGGVKVESDKIAQRQAVEQLKVESEIAQEQAVEQPKAESEEVARQQAVERQKDELSLVEALEQEAPGLVAKQPAVSKPAVSEPVVSKPAVSEAAVPEAAVPEAAVPEAAVPAPVVSAPVVSEPVTPEVSYIDVINRKRSIRQSHTQAVVNDAVAKVQEYVDKGDFDKAKEEVASAERIVNEYKLDLGDELFNKHSSELNQLAETIAQEQEKRELELQEQKRLEAIDAQRQYREQMEADRNKRIAELMDNATAYQSQQRYEEALGQLESLLAIDPLNNNALILKQTLEDMVSFKRQLEIQRESGRERVENLIENEAVMVPYAKELTHSEDWRTIIASPFRKPDEPIGLDPADVAVYKQLDEIVNLTQLTPEMPFNEAIEILKNSSDPPLRIFVNWRDLYDNADIDQTTPINMDPISAIPLRKALGLLLDAVSGGFVDINFIVEGGVITIATTASLPNEMVPLVYDITDLIGRPAEFYASTMGSVTAAGEGEAGTEEIEVEEQDRDQLIEEASIRADNLVLLIQQTINPESWYEAGGDGTITVYERKKLIIHQTREVHDKIAQLLEDLRKALGHQVAIEARFLVVGENFLEDIGLDVDFRVDVGGDVGLLSFEQDTADLASPTDTGVTGSLASSLVTDLGTSLSAMTATGGYGDLILNDLEVSIILRATQAHRDAQSVTAPKVTVLSGEMATMRVIRFRRYPYNIETDIEEIGDFGDYRYTVDWEQGVVTSGTLLNITPIITPDKKNVLLNVVTEMREFLGWEPYDIQLPVLGAGLAGDNTYSITFPDTEISRVETRVSVPDRATLLLGGQRITAEVEREAGVPVLSKLPVLGRLFTNRSKVKDNLILLILVKPTIILRDEAEAKAIAAMEGNI